MSLSEAEELEMLELEKQQSEFSSTKGGAATGNPMLRRQGDKAARSGFNADPFAAISGAGAIGAGLGAASKEILTGAGNVIGGFPYPAARTIGGFLKGAGQVIGAGGRAAPTIAGGISGIASEGAGQAAEAAGAGPVTAEAARIVGGGVSPIPDAALMGVLQKYVKTPALSLWSKVKKETALSVLEKLEKDPGSLSARERQFIDSEIAAIHGSQKPDEALNSVGTLMGERGQNLVDFADQQLVRAQGRVAGARQTGQPEELSAIGGRLRDTITARNEAALSARSKQYAETEKVRDTLVAQREGAKQYPSDLPEFKKVTDSLQAELDNSEAMKRSPDVQRSLQKILNELKSVEETPGKQVLVQNGLNLDLQTTPGAPKPTTFQAIDDVRRKLGEVFKGKPAEGYEALNDERGRRLYAQLTDLQKKYAGGESGPHAKLLEDYHSQSEALAPFRSKAGKKATALDQFEEGRFATDATTLPSSYFKTRASVQALKELTGNANEVNQAALQYANRQIAGKDATQVRKWLGDNSDWLQEVGAVRTTVDRYATKLEGVERSLRNAEDFAKQAAADKKMLVGKQLPAQRAIDLIKSGDTELWERAVPAIVQSTQAKKQMVDAVRQVVSEQATNKATIDLFGRNIRPFLEKSNIGTKAEMDQIAERLARIQTMNIPEPEKLGMARRILLQAAGGWAASAGGRAGSAGYNYATGVPQ